ncbi:MAG: ATP-binding cassette domain-containing protein [Pseudomonadota bacterium]
MIRLQQLGLRIDDRNLLEDIDLALVTGCVAIIGPNGAGKSTLLHLCADGGRSRPEARTSGQALLDGVPLRQLPPERLAQRRAFLPQQHADALPFPVAAILALATWPHGGGLLPPALRDEAVARWELGALLTRPYAALSGGERQRVQLARTWLQLRLHPVPGERLWLLDEPQSSLDLPHQQVLLDCLREEAAAGALVLFSTHDINFALRAADRILALRAGRLMADVSPAGLAEPGLLREVFGVGFLRLAHPADGRPLLLPE